MNLTAPLISFVAVYLSTPIFRKIAQKVKALDIPNHRKVHKSPIPLLGGIAVYLGVALGLWLNFNQSSSFLGVFLAATLILITGLIDDMMGLSVQIRLAVQFLAALILIGLGLKLSFLPNNLWGNAGEIILTFIWVIGITNALNNLDGIDGLASGSAAISSFFFAFISYRMNQPQLGMICLILGASCLGFLPHNFSRNKIFLGDAGSNFIGFTLASVALTGDWAKDSVVRISVPVLILAVPIFDMIFTSVMRVKEEKVRSVLEWLKYGGKDHLHHRLVDLGLSPAGAVVFIYFVTFSFGISALIVSRARAFVGVLSILQAGIILTGIAVLSVVGKKDGR